eukprot:786718-Pyramimonas_sp.AAC.1
MATLMDAGWTPKTATPWHRPGPGEMEMWGRPTSEGGAFVGTGCFQELLDDLEGDQGRDLWTEAAKHEFGDNLQAGGDLWPIVMEQRRLERKGMLDQLALNVT